MGLVGEATRECNIGQAFRRGRNQQFGSLDAPDRYISHGGSSESQLERTAEMTLAEYDQRGYFRDTDL
jgi:hypothetical protein